MKVRCNISLIIVTLVLILSPVLTGYTQVEIPPTVPVENPEFINNQDETVEIVDNLAEPAPIATPIQPETKNLELDDSLTDANISASNPVAIDEKTIPSPSSHFDNFQSTDEQELSFGNFTESTNDPISNTDITPSTPLITNNSTFTQSTNISDKILSSGVLTFEDIISYLSALPNSNFVVEPVALLTLYLDESSTENINSDIAVAQMLFATNHLQNINFLSKLAEHW